MEKKYKLIKARNSDKKRLEYVIKEIHYFITTLGNIEKIIKEKLPELYKENQDNQCFRKLYNLLLNYRREQIMKVCYKEINK